MKGKEEASERMINVIEASQLSDTEFKAMVRENEDGGIGRHTAPPRTTRTDRKSNGKEIQH